MRKPLVELEVDELPPRRLLGLRHIGSYGNVSSAFIELAAIAAERGLIGPSTEFVGLSYDDPDTTRENELRYDACITSNATDVSAPLQTIEHAGGRHVAYRHVGPYELLQDAFSRMFDEIASAGVYTLRAAPCVEIYRNSPENTAPAELITDICIPIL